ncbi:MAG: hypothetical protein R3F62_21055 [Planctomycetota bacterium]
MTAPTTTPERSDAERRRLAERLTAQLRERVSSMHALLAPLRAEIDQHRMAQRGVLEFVNDLWERQGFTCSFDEDGEEVTQLFLDALTTARMLLIYEGPNLPPECWAQVEEAMDEFDHTCGSVRIDYDEQQARTAEEDWL